MFENLKPEIIVLVISVLAGIFVILGNFFQLRDRFTKWYKSKVKKYRPTDMKASDSSIKILNFHHPLTKEQIQKIEEMLNKPIAEIVPLNTHLDETRPFRPQLCDLITAAKISSESLQHGEYIINLPGYAPAAAVLIAELHGRMGHFPTVIRLKKVEGSLPPVFDVEEIVNLQAIRDEARMCR